MSSDIVKKCQELGITLLENYTEGYIDLISYVGNERITLRKFYDTELGVEEYQREYIIMNMVQELLNGKMDKLKYHKHF